jgi:hypothetical protein
MSSWRCTARRTGGTCAEWLQVAGFERLSSASNFGAVGSIGMKLVTCSRDPKAHPHPFHYHRKNAEPLAAHLWLSASTVCTTRVT